MKLPSRLFAALAVLAGCTANGAPPTTDRQPIPQSGDEPSAWQIQFDVSGGFAGMHRQLLLNSKGMARASDRKTGRQVESTLEAGQLAEIEGMLKRLGGTPAPTNQSKLARQCADCIEYRIETKLNNQRQSIILRSGAELEPPFADLVGRLSTLLQQTLTKN